MSRSTVSAKRGLRLSKMDVLWIVIGAVVPILLAVAHYLRKPTDEAGLIVTAALIFGAFSLLITRIQAVERELEDLRHATTRHTAATGDVVAAALTGADMADCRQLFLTFKAILDFGNPLMTALANEQFRSLSEFLKQFDKVLPFYPKHELITIEKHYLSFMKRMGRRGRYDATTFIEFWLEQDDAILRDFFHSNRLAAHDGVTIRRVFLIGSEDVNDPITRGVLTRHASISSKKYRNGGSISTRVLADETVSRDKDDFGIYILDGEPMAIAVAKFDPASDKLQGNDVSFDKEIMRTTRELFEHRWQKATEIHRYLGD